MSRAVEIYFDAAADRRVRDLWEELSKQKLHGMPPPSAARPHISLGVWNKINLDVAGPSLQGFAPRIAGLGFRFESVALFANAGVIYFAPTVTSELLRIHQRFHNQFAEGEDCSDYYRPGCWTPHCTIAERIAPPNVAAIMQIAAATTLPFDANAHSVGIVEHPGAKLLAEFVVTPEAYT